MEQYTNTELDEQQITTIDRLTAVSYAAAAIRHAADCRISPSQKQRTSEIGETARAHYTLEPQAIEEGLALYVTNEESQYVAQAALFFTGTGHYDTIRVRSAAPPKTLLAIQAFRANVYTPLETKKK